MSAIGGERDVLLQATADRYSTVAEGKNIVLSAVPPLFHLNADGKPAQQSIAVTAKPINLVGAIEFSATGAALAVNGNVATVDYATVTSEPVVVQAKIREFGVDHIFQYVIGTVRDGDVGLSSLNTAHAFAYKRSNTYPSDSPGDVIYTFSGGAITTPAGNDLANGWSKNIPGGSAPLYVRVADASSRNASATVAANTWCGAVLLDGGGIGALKISTVRIYQRGLTNLAPALPSAPTSYDFSREVLTDLNNGWSTQLPSSGGPYLFRSAAVAVSRGDTDEIMAGEWAAAARLAADGADGQRGTVTITAPGYSEWSDASAVYEIGQAGYGDPINRDVVTLYNATQAVTKFYSNGSWYEVGAVINGNLLVAGTVAAQALDVDDLAAISGKFSRMTSGDIEGAVIHGGAGYPYGHGYTWPTNGGFGYRLGPEGLLLGNYAAGSYVQLGADGTFKVPGLSIVNGVSKYTGLLEGVRGSFALMQSPARINNANAAGYDLKADGWYCYDGVNALPYIELGEYL